MTWTSAFDCGDKIFVLEIPAQSPADIGPYCRINGRKADGDPAHPFGDDKDGWWSFNRPYSGPFRVVDALTLKGLSMTDIDLLDARYKPREEWPKGLLALEGMPLSTGSAYDELLGWLLGGARGSGDFFHRRQAGQIRNDEFPDFPEAELQVLITRLQKGETVIADLLKGGRDEKVL